MLVDLMKELQAEKSQTRFAGEIGISQRMLSMIYIGRRRAGLRVVTGLVWRFPERRDEIIASFFADHPDNRHVQLADEVGETDTVGERIEDLVGVGKGA